MDVDRYRRPQINPACEDHPRIRAVSLETKSVGFTASSRSTGFPVAGVHGRSWEHMGVRNYI